MDFSAINYMGWKFWMTVIVFSLFILWAFFGGGNHEYIGLSPLKIGVDSSQYIDNSLYHKVEKSNTEAKVLTAKPVDKTPKLPNIPIHSKFKSGKIKSKKAEKFSFSSNFDDISEEPISDNMLEPYEENFCSNEYEEAVKTPNTLALGDHKQFKTKNLSKGEELCKKVIEEIYEKPFYCVRPDFLKNPETNRNLELDCYNDELKIAVEFNGSQHYKWPNYTNQTYEDFIKQVRRDQFKVEACDKNGVYLITVPYNVPKHAIKDYIHYYLPENVKNRNI